LYDRGVRDQNRGGFVGAERRDKPCTFPGCQGRMVLTHEEWEPDPALGQLAGGPLRRSSTWTCETDEAHREDALPADRVS
jgi:hypothetical protein